MRSAVRCRLYSSARQESHDESFRQLAPELIAVFLRSRRSGDIPKGVFAQESRSLPPPGLVSENATSPPQFDRNLLFLLETEQTRRDLADIVGDAATRILHDHEPCYMRGGGMDVSVMIHR